MTWMTKDDKGLPRVNGMTRDDLDDYESLRMNGVTRND